MTSPVHVRTELKENLKIMTHFYTIMILFLHSDFMMGIFTARRQLLKLKMFMSLALWPMCEELSFCLKRLLA